MTYRRTVKLLSDAGIENAEYEAALLLEKFCGVKQASLPFSKDINFDSSDLSTAVEKRKNRYPLQYILGEWYFRGEKFKVDENCLIPRPDTELLVEIAGKMLPKNALFADLCTGSGCIAVSLLCERRDCRALAADIFPKTLSLAEENAKTNGVSDRFFPLLLDVLKVPNGFPVGVTPPFDAVISNPPYIRTEVVPTLSPEVCAEPSAALDGGADGLVFYRSILANFRQLLKKDGVFAFEIGYDQGDDIKQIAYAYGLSCKVLKDLGGNDRVAIIKL